MSLADSSYDHKLACYDCPREIVSDNRVCLFDEVEC
jgi:hypothetical protein